MAGQKIAGTQAKRRDRFDMVRFAQGVFKNVEGDRAIDALIALGGIADIAPSW